MDMLPPTLKNSAGISAGNNYKDFIFVGTATMMMGEKTIGRLPVRRALFRDESPENSPPTTTINNNFLPTSSIEDQLKRIDVVEKERAKNLWGFDFSTETPCTSRSSQYEWIPMKSTDVPKFYTQIRGPNSISNATFTTPPNDDRLMPTSLSLPSSDLVQSLSTTDSTTMDVEVEATTSIDTMDTAPIIRSIKYVDATPKNVKKTRKRRGNNSPMACQTPLTKYFQQAKRSEINSGSIKKPKRPIDKKAQSIKNGAETSTTIRP